MEQIQNSNNLDKLIKTLHIEQIEQIEIENSFSKLNLKSNFSSNINDNFKHKSVVAIVAHPYPENSDDTEISYINYTYYCWLTELNTHIININIYDSKKNITKYIKINKVSGILFTGGMRDLRDGKFEQQSSFLIALAGQLQIPIWFTCQGFQLIHCLLAGDYKILNKCKAMQTILPNIFVDKKAKTKMFSHFNDTDKENSEKFPAYVHFNNWGITIDTFMNYGLNKYLKVTSFFNDKIGQQFIGTVESIDSEEIHDKNKNDNTNSTNLTQIFACQFHPEKAKNSFMTEKCNQVTFECSLKIGKGFIDQVNKRQKELILGMDNEEINKFFEGIEYIRLKGGAIDGNGNKDIKEEVERYYFRKGKLITSAKEIEEIERK